MTTYHNRIFRATLTRSPPGEMEGECSKPPLERPSPDPSPARARALVVSTGGFVAYLWPFSVYPNSARRFGKRSVTSQRSVVG